jgi:hypothetical protein
MGRSDELDETTEDPDEESEEQDSESDVDTEESFYEGDVPPNLDKSYKEMQRAFTKKTTQLANERKQYDIEVERLKQKADMYDKLASDPEQAIEVLTRMSGKSSKNRSSDPDEDDDFSDYGDQAESMKRLVKAITDKVTKSVTQQVSPLIQNTQEASFEKEMNSLSLWAESQSKKIGFNLPDPRMYEPTIRRFVNEQGMSTKEAYQASMNFDKLSVRKPVIEKKKSGSFQPGGVKGTRPSSKGLSTDDAIERRKSGKRGGLSLEELTDMYSKGELS